MFRFTCSGDEAGVLTQGPKDCLVEDLFGVEFDPLAKSGITVSATHYAIDGPHTDRFVQTLIP